MCSTPKLSLPWEDWALAGWWFQAPRLTRRKRRQWRAYVALDLVECGGTTYIATRDNPGACPPGPEDGWQILSRPIRGPVGEVGPRGRKGERGARGEAAPAIISWVLDIARYRAIPTLADGRAGAPLDLRDLFQQFLNEGAIDAAVDAAMRDAARAPKLLWPL
jgi:hypothetical protein